MLRELRVKLQMPENKIKRLIIILAAVLAAVTLLILAVCAVPMVANAAVCSVGDRIVEDLDGERYDCILVLGAGLKSDGTPSAMLADRLEVAIKLYKEGVSDVILLSGDHKDDSYNEVSSMERYCLVSGVPENAIVKDGKGYSTFESILNTKNSDKYERILIVTQKYHLYRAIYIAERLGMSAEGVDATLRPYRNQLFRELREVAARTKDFFIVMWYEG